MKVSKKQKRLFVRTMICTVSLVTACFFCSSLEAAAAPRAQETGERVTIVIDPGHGGENEGTLEGIVQEKKMTMVTAMAMYEELLKYDNVDVYLTHTEDVNFSLADRAQFAAERNADFLFSIHYNASVDHDLFGSEVLDLFRTAIQCLRLSIRLGTDAADERYGTVPPRRQDKIKK